MRYWSKWGCSVSRALGWALPTCLTVVLWLSIQSAAAASGTRFILFDAAEGVSSLNERTVRSEAFKLDTLSGEVWRLGAGGAAGSVAFQVVRMVEKPGTATYLDPVRWLSEIATTGPDATNSSLSELVTWLNHIGERSVPNFRLLVCADNWRTNRSADVGIELGRSYPTSPDDTSAPVERMLSSRVRVRAGRQSVFDTLVAITSQLNCSLAFRDGQVVLAPGIPSRTAYWTVYDCPTRWFGVSPDLTQELRDAGILQSKVSASVMLPETGQIALFDTHRGHEKARALIDHRARMVGRFSLKRVGGRRDGRILLVDGLTGDVWAYSNNAEEVHTSGHGPCFVRATPVHLPESHVYRLPGLKGVDHPAHSGSERQ